MHKQSRHDIVHSFAGKTILIVGDLILDEYVWGKARRLSPEAPVPVVELEKRTHRLGGAGNVAANVQSLGGSALLASAIGADPHGSLLLGLLDDAGMDVDGILTVDDRRTTTKSRLMAHNQQIARVDDERIAPLAPRLEEDLLNWIEACMATVDACVISDYGKGLISPDLAERFIGLARRYSKAVLVDPKGTNFVKYRGATLVKPNLNEVERLFNVELHQEDEVCEAGRRLLELLPGSALLLTRGQRGMSFFRASRPTLHIPSVARHVYDVTGAGDTVASILALALAAAVDLETAAYLANFAAGLVVGKLGTAQVGIDELLDGDYLLGIPNSANEIIESRRQQIDFDHVLGELASSYL